MRTLLVVALLCQSKDYFKEQLKEAEIEWKKEDVLYRSAAEKVTTLEKKILAGSATEGDARSYEIEKTSAALRLRDLKSALYNVIRLKKLTMFSDKEDRINDLAQKLDQQKRILAVDETALREIQEKSDNLSKRNAAERKKNIEEEQKPLIQRTEKELSEAKTALTDDERKAYESKMKVIADLDAAYRKLPLN